MRVLEDRALAFGHLHGLVDEGVNLAEATDLVADSCREGEVKRGLQAAALRLAEGMPVGDALSFALPAGHPTDQLSGDGLVAGLASTAALFSERLTHRRRVRAVRAYPLFIIAVAGGVLLWTFSLGVASGSVAAGLSFGGSEPSGPFVWLLRLPLVFFAAAGVWAAVAATRHGYQVRRLVPGATARDWSAWAIFLADLAQRLASSGHGGPTRAVRDAARVHPELSRQLRRTLSHASVTWMLAQTHVSKHLLATLRLGEAAGDVAGAAALAADQAGRRARRAARIYMQVVHVILLLAAAYIIAWQGASNRLGGLLWLF